MSSRAVRVLILLAFAAAPLRAQKPDVGSRVRFQRGAGPGDSAVTVTGRVARWTDDSLVVRTPGRSGATVALPRSQVVWLEVAHPVPAWLRGLRGMGAGAVLGLLMGVIVEGEPDEDNVLADILKVVLVDNPLVAEPQRVSDRMGLGVAGRIIAPAVPLAVLFGLGGLVTRADRWERIHDKSVGVDVVRLPGGRLGLGMALSF
jgi:hypothetical protein